jgi:heavy metal efflux system protein
MLDRIISFCLGQKIFVLLVITFIVGWGAYSASTLSTDAFPDVTGTQVDVLSKLSGMSPLEIERFVSTPLEIAMRGLPGLKEMRSTSKFGISVITIVFQEKTDIYFARQQVLERLIEIKETLPPGTETSLGPISTAMGEIYQYVLDDQRPGEGNAPERLMQLRDIQDWILTPYLKNIPGVNEIDPFGGYIKQYQVIINPDRLKKYGIGLREAYEAIARNNLNVGGSFIELGKEQFLIRGLGLVESLKDIENITLRSEGGARVLLSDVAEIKEGQAIRHGAALMNGDREVVGACVLMLSGCNSRRVVKEIEQHVKDINEGGLMPEGITIKPYYDRSDIVNEATRTLGEALGEGILLIIAVIYFFLRSPRGAWVIISALILSILGSVIIMKLAGLTANLMTLGGLIISLGMIIDSAIIQTENVQRHLSLGASSEGKVCTVLKAVLEVRKPSILGELIIALTFLPLLALEGLEGKMFSPLAIAVFIALMVSLFLSIFITPVLCLLALKPKKESARTLFSLIKDTYSRMLRKALSCPRIIIGGAAAIFVISLVIIPFLGTEFLPVMDEGAFDMDVLLYPGSSLDNTVEMSKKIQKIVKQYPELETVVSRLGWSGIGLGAQDMDSGIATGKFKPRREWKSARTREALVNKMRDSLAVIPGVVISFSQPIQCRIDELVAGTKSQVVIKLFGDDLEVLRARSQELCKIVAKVRGTRDLIIEQVSGQQFINIKANRQKIAQYGLNVSEVQDLVEIALGGKSAGSFYEGNRAYSIVMRFDEKDRDSVEAIGNLLVDIPGQEIKLPLKEIADITIDEGPVKISHESGQRKIMLQCNVQGRDLGGYVNECKTLIRERVRLPQGYHIEWGGQFENQQKAFKKLTLIVPVTIGVIFLLLFATFNSLPMALLVLLTLPLALIGGIFSLFVSRSYLSVPASIGFIALFGIAVLNGVVLISYINQLREEGLPLEDSIIKGCETRLRPVLMTASIAIFSLAPLLFSSGPGSEVQRPLALVVVGGLLTSTLMSIFVLPVLYRRFIVVPREPEVQCGG